MRPATSARDGKRTRRSRQALRLRRPRAAARRGRSGSNAAPRAASLAVVHVAIDAAGATFTQRRKITLPFAGEGWRSSEQRFGMEAEAELPVRRYRRLGSARIRQPGEGAVPAACPSCASSTNVCTVRAPAAANTSGAVIDSPSSAPQRESTCLATGRQHDLGIMPVTGRIVCFRNAVIAEPGRLPAILEHRLELPAR